MKPEYIAVRKDEYSELKTDSVILDWLLVNAPQKTPIIKEWTREGLKALMQHGNDTWHAPGLGEVHNADHTKLIYCSKVIKDADERVDDELAARVCELLNRDTNK